MEIVEKTKISSKRAQVVTVLTPSYIKVVIPEAEDLFKIDAKAMKAEMNEALPVHNDNGYVIEQVFAKHEGAWVVPQYLVDDAKAEVENLD